VPISLSGGDANEMERSMDPRITWANPQVRSGKDPCKFHPLGVELRRRWVARSLQRRWWRLHDCVTPDVAAFRVHADGSLYCRIHRWPSNAGRPHHHITHPSSPMRGAPRQVGTIEDSAMT
jgi:hypothetical protein